MLNREVYQRDPTTHPLVNNGVAKVSDETSASALKVLRYELETFVCDGQYQKGLAHILDTYLRNLDQPQQQAVWVSGFYGSGKSHLVKMLRALWVDTLFPGGASARGLATLPPEVQDALKELSVQGRRHGGLHAASGTLGDEAAGSTRLALLSIVFRSVGLPAIYNRARFVMWLRGAGIEDTVRDQVLAQGGDWEVEIDNLLLAENLRAALVATKPNLFSSLDACGAYLNNTFPDVRDVSTEDMLKVIKAALANNGTLPLTLIALDEVQQYIGDNVERAREVQEIVEACSKQLGAKVLFVATGQTAITGTPSLQKLEGRFTVRIELSDADVDTVIRQVILAKKPDAYGPLKKVMEGNQGEISRHLDGTALAHRPGDASVFAQDYPILPVRRRFWEHTLRVLDQTGTASQLRNQLMMVHKAALSNLDAPLGHVIPADFLFFDLAERLLQFRVLPRQVYDQTRLWSNGTSDDRLKARACGLVFLTNRLTKTNKELGLRADADTLADLMVDDLGQGSSALRSKLPALLTTCELLMKVGQEYRIQTDESAAWNDEFQSQVGAIANELYRVDTERNDRIQSRVRDLVRKVSLTQGTSKVARELTSVFGQTLPPDADKRLCVWVRDGWSTEEATVRADARAAGTSAPTVYVFIPKRAGDDVLRQIIEFKAAEATIQIKGNPDGPEGQEAYAAIDTVRQEAERRINELLGDCLDHAVVIQAGGSEVQGLDLKAMIQQAAQASMQRLYPRFSDADHTGWAKVYEKAQQGAPDALKAVGFDGQPADNVVTKAILGSLAAGKKGSDIRALFEGPPYGWSRDSVDGALQTLHVVGLVRAQDEHFRPINATQVERKAIGKTTYLVEATHISATQRVKIRGVLLKAGLTPKPNEELAVMPAFLGRMEAMVDGAGGEAPRPPRPDTTTLEAIRLTAGNEQLLTVFNHADELAANVDAWKLQGDDIAARWPQWELLLRLLCHAEGLVEGDVLRQQADAIRQHRQLLAEPDPVVPLVSGVSQLLRDQLCRLDGEYATSHSMGMARLQNEPGWGKRTIDEQDSLLARFSLHAEARPKIVVKSAADVLVTLDRVPLAGFRDRVAALSGRFEALVTELSRQDSPEATIVRIPGGTLASQIDLDDWLAEARRVLAAALEKGPVIVQ